MEYPEREKMYRVLKFLYGSEQQGGLRIKSQHKEVKRLITRRVKAQRGVHDEETGEDILSKLDLSANEFLKTLDRLRNAGYIEAPIKKYPSYDIYTFYYVTEVGLRALGMLPDPQAQFIQGLQAAIEAIKQDDRLTEEEKQREINWLQEGTVVARTLTIDAIKAIVSGINV
jgi:hypothetical protein